MLNDELRDALREEFAAQLKARINQYGELVLERGARLGTDDATVATLKRIANKLAEEWLEDRLIHVTPVPRRVSLGGLVFDIHVREAPR